MRVEEGRGARQAVLGHDQPGTEGGVDRRVGGGGVGGVGGEGGVGGVDGAGGGDWGCGRGDGARGGVKRDVFLEIAVGTSSEVEKWRG